MRSRHLLAALAIVVAPAPLLAQFTTVVSPPRRPRPPVVAARDTTIPRGQQEAREEQRRQMLDIKAWVDSAAGALAGRPNAATSTRAPAPPTAPVTPPDTARSRRPPAAPPDSATRRPPPRPPREAPPLRNP